MTQDCRHGKGREEVSRVGATRAGDGPPEGLGATLTERRLARLPQVSLRDQVVDAIRAAIVRGAFRPGEKVPEQELASELGVSRTPVREAIRILEEQGLVETRPKSGTFVTRVDHRDARDGLVVRTALEELAVRQALQRMDRGAWERFCDGLEDLLRGMRQAVRRGDPVTATQLDVEWHTELIHAADNRYLSRAWRMVGLPFLVWTPERDLYPQTREEWFVGFIQRHGELLAALRTGDPELCAEAVRSHIAKKLADLERAHRRGGQAPPGEGGAIGSTSETGGDRG